MRRAAILLGLVLVSLSVLMAQAQGGFDLSWWTMGSGGGTASGSSYTLAGTVGQADVGPALSGGSSTLAGGFWGNNGAPFAETPTPTPTLTSTPTPTTTDTPTPANTETPTLTATATPTPSGALDHIIWRFRLDLGVVQGLSQVPEGVGVFG